MKDVIRSFKNAIRGLKVLALSERNFKIELAIALLAVLLSCALGLNANEWALIILSIALVLLAELINTSIEKILDFVHPHKNNTVRDIKDLSAGAVLVAALFSCFIALLVFVPKLLDLAHFYVN